MKISVAMTTYNSSKYLLEQLNSILIQTIPFDELVIIDDCSTDDTYNLLTKFRDSNKDKNILVFQNKKNIGYVQAFKKSIEYCSGDVIFLCDHDDIWQDNKLSVMIEYLNENIMCLGSSFNKIDSLGNQIKPSKKDNKHNWGYIKKKINGKAIKISLKELFYCNFTPGCCLCFSQKIKDSVCALLNEAPHDYLISCFCAISEQLCFLNEKLINYRVHDSNVLGVNKGINYIGRLTVAKRDYNDKLEIYNSLKKYFSIRQEKVTSKIVELYKKRYHYFEQKKITHLIFLSIKYLFINHQFSKTLLKDVLIILKGR